MWEKIYKVIKPPKTNPCMKCSANGSCDSICPARAKWWDVFRRNFIGNH